MEKLNDIFNIEPVQREVVYSPTVVLKEEIKDSEDDYELARRTLREVITKGTSALDDIISLARSSEHPRGFEVAGQLMKTMSEVSKDLLQLHKQKQEIDKPTANVTQQSIGQQNNIVFAGSTQDLLQMIEQKNSERLIDSTDSQYN
jgi:hypothetical protein